MLVYTIVWLLGVVSLVSAAAVNSARHIQVTPLPTSDCAITVTQYVTITHVPPVVTIAVPNITEISRSLASASTIDSIVVVEQSQDRPVSNHPDTSIPTFINTILASAFEATEISGTGSTAIYVPVGTDLTHTPTSKVVIGLTTISVLPQAVTISTSSAAVSSTNTSAVSISFSGLDNDWNGTLSDSIIVSPAPVSASNPATGPRSIIDSFQTTTTAISYVATVTEEVTATMPPVLALGHGPVFPSLINWPTGGAGLAKRQTCVLVSADVGNHQTATWCNNWDGSTVMTYTSWETTITPGHNADSTASLSSSVQSSPVVMSTSSTKSITSVQVSTSPTTLSQTVVPVESSLTVSPTTSANPAATSCGQTGVFDISFDDLPAQSVFPNETAGSPPIFNPFDHFFWEAGWTYGPPPAQPYTPHNGDQLAIYNVTLSNDMSNSPNAGSIVKGGFSAGPRSSLDQYWFNATSAWVGCQSNLTSSVDVCDFVAEGYVWNNDTQQEQLIVTQHFKEPLCQTEHCDLHLINFSDKFKGLCTLSFYANINGQLRDFYVDDMQMGWWNNTCNAGLMRISSRK